MQLSLINFLYVRYRLSLCPRQEMRPLLFKSLSSLLPVGITSAPSPTTAWATKSPPWSISRKRCPWSRIITSIYRCCATSKMAARSTAARRAISGDSPCVAVLAQACCCAGSSIFFVAVAGFAVDKANLWCYDDYDNLIEIPWQFGR